MYANTIRELTDAELVTKFLDLKEELFTLRFQSATGSLEKHNLIPQVKKDIARVETVMRERQLSEEDSSSLSVSDPADPANVRSNKSSSEAKSSKKGKK